MMRVDTSLVTVVETAECHLLAGIASAVQQRRPSLAGWTVPIAGGLASFCGPDAPTNKIAGLGFGGVPERDQLAAIEARFHQCGAPVVVELASHADPQVVALFGERGYRLTGCENVLGMALPLASGELAAAPGVTIEALAATASRGPWIETLLDGFAAPDGSGVPSPEFPRQVVGEVMRDMAAVDDYRCSLAMVDGVLAGAAGLHLGREVAHLCGAATLPAHRRRGVQSSLVRDRLARANAAGCRWVVTITQPGSTSQTNMQRQGFVLLYVRTVLVLPPPRV